MFKIDDYENEVATGLVNTIKKDWTGMGFGTKGIHVNCNRFV